jgi:hypothetical protein
MDSPGLPNWRFFSASFMLPGPIGPEVTVISFALYLSSVSHEANHQSRVEAAGL